MTISFRFDDPSATSDHALESEILERFRRHAIPLTVAVIPFRPATGTRPLAATDVPHLVKAHQEGLIEVALHGHSHARHSRTPRGIPSEFADRPFVEQLDMLKSGRQALEQAFGSPIHGFVPPWNTFDHNTVLAAGQAGFRYVGGGIGAISGPADNDTSLVIPKTCNMREADIERALQIGARYSHYKPWAVLVFHPDNFVEFRSPPSEGEISPWLSLDRLDKILEGVRSNATEVRPMTLADAMSLGGNRPRFWDSNELAWVSRYSHRVYNALPKLLLFPGSRWTGIRAVARTALFR